MFLDKYESSPLLGSSQILSDDGKRTLELLVSNSPLAVFQALNKKFNKKGLCSQITKTPV